MNNNHYIIAYADAFGEPESYTPAFPTLEEAVEYYTTFNLAESIFGDFVILDNNGRDVTPSIR